MLAVPPPAPVATVVPAQRHAPDGWLEEGPGAGAPLLVAFGGMPEQPGTLPGFEFRGLRARLGADAVHGLFLRDPSASWYLGGVPGAAPNLPALAGWLAGQLDRLQPRRIVLLGNSAGAYAALAVGALLGADEVIAFVPRSGLSDPVCQALGDDRLAATRARALARYAGNGSPLDLPGVLETAFAQRVAQAGGRPAYRTRFRVLHALDNALDSAHARRLAGLPEVAVSAYPRGDHQLIRVLRASGELDLLVGQALRVPLPG